MILAGPILRRTDAKAVNVWIALDENIDLDLILKNDAGANISGIGSSNKISLGKKLVIQLLTFVPGIAFVPGKIFSYDVLKKGTTTSILTALLTNDAPLGYKKDVLPSFVLPAANLKDLIVAHGSCRRMAGEGPDAMSILDEQLKKDHKDPLKRIQQLFLTGDQVYADEIPRYGLWAITKKAQEIINEKEDLALPDLHLTFPDEEPAGSFDFTATRIDPTDAPSGLREPLINKFAKMSTGEGQSHLMTFGEFCIAHLYAWSPDVWDEELKNAAKNFDKVTENWNAFQTNTAFDLINYTARKHLHPMSSKAFADFAGEFDKFQERHKRGLTFELKQVNDFLKNLPLVRRVLANIPTYMIFDDHEISDDWNITMKWKNEVYNNTLGKAVVRNGLMAYSVCQDLGNVPADYQVGSTSKKPTLLNQIKDYAKAPNFAVFNTSAIDQLLGINTISSQPEVKWHFAFTSGDKVKTLFLDTRNRRGLSALNSRPELLDESAFTEQFNLTPTPATDDTLFVVSACPAIGLSVFEEMIYPIATSVKGIASGDGSFNSGQIIFDNEAWYLNSKAFEKLLSKLSAFKQVVIFSGDIHYSFTTFIDYWKKNDTKPSSRFIQLVSSPLKNLWKKNIRLFQSGFVQGVFGGFGGKVEKFGWENPPEVKGVDISLVNLRRLRESPAVIDNFGLKNTVKITPNPDWRYRLSVGFDDRADDKIEHLPAEFHLKDDFDHKKIKDIRRLAERFTEDFRNARSRRLMFANQVCVVSFKDNKLLHSFFYRSADDETVILKMVHEVALAAAGDDLTQPKLPV